MENNIAVHYMGLDGEEYFHQGCSNLTIKHGFLQYDHHKLIGDRVVQLPLGRLLYITSDIGAHISVED